MSKAGSREEGFTLVESLVAMLVAASSNTVANQGTAAATAASERMEVLRNLQFGPAATANTLLSAIGGNLGTSPTTPLPCNPAGGAAVPPPGNPWYCTDDIPGVGRIVTRWQISVVGGTGRMVFIQVRSEGTGALSQRRSRAEFTTLRSCTDATPVTTAGVIACPDVP